MRANTFVLALCLVAAVQAGDPCAKHKECKNKKDFCAKEGGCTPCSSCSDNAMSITGKCPCGPAKKKLGGKCTSHKGCTMKEFCPKPEENGAQVCKPCRECKDHPDSSTDKCPCGPGKKNGPLGGDCKASHDDCRVQDFCGTLRPGKCELCIKCADNKNSADGDCPCGPAYVATVRKTCVAAMEAKGCLGKPTKACETAAMAVKEDLLKAGCTVPFVRKQCAVAAKASAEGTKKKNEVDDLIDGLESDL